MTIQAQFFQLEVIHNNQAKFLTKKDRFLVFGDGYFVVLVRLQF